MDQDYKLQFFTYVLSQFLQRYIYPQVSAREFSDYEIPGDERHLRSWFDDVRLTLPDKLVTIFRRRFTGDLTALVQCASEHIKSLHSNDGTLILYGDTRYPKLLSTIVDPPLGLNVLGSTQSLGQSNMNAIVGARRATPFALKQSYALGKLLARNGSVIVSGGAYGCDIAAHHGVLANCLAEAPAVTVFAGGLSQLYPRGNLQVFASIREQGGALISERLWQSPSRPADFPVRNRIIAGLVPRLIITQAAVSSGALQTAGRALAYGRDVYVLVHQGLGEAFNGNLRLLLDGAIGFSDAESLLQNEFIGFRLLDDEAPKAFSEQNNFLV